MRDIVRRETEKVKAEKEQVSEREKEKTKGPEGKGANR